MNTILREMPADKPDYVLDMFMSFVMGALCIGTLAHLLRHSGQFHSPNFVSAAIFVAAGLLLVDAFMFADAYLCWRWQRDED